MIYQMNLGLATALICALIIMLIVPADVFMLLLTLGNMVVLCVLLVRMHSL